MTDHEKIDRDLLYRAAKRAYDDAERAFTVAQAKSHQAENARRREWDRLVAAAEHVQGALGRKLSQEQFGSQPNKGA